MLGIFDALTVVMTQIPSKNASLALVLPIVVDGPAAVPEPVHVRARRHLRRLDGGPHPDRLPVEPHGVRPGEHRFTDVFKVGLPLLAILGVVNAFLLDWYWPLTG